MEARVKGVVVEGVQINARWGWATGATATTTVTLRFAGRDRMTVSGS
jgi:hypothetical protein